MIFKRKETVSPLTKLTKREIKGMSIYLHEAENNERNVIRGSELKYNRYAQYDLQARGNVSRPTKLTMTLYLAPRLAVAPLLH